MEDSQYDKKSVSSIYEYALKLIGKTLSQSSELPEQVVNTKNRGDLGRLVEKYYFKHNPPNNHEPDFADAGLELKTTGLVEYKKLPKNGELIRAKERLVLTSIDYTTLRDEEFVTSTFMHKCNLMLIIFYKYDGNVSVIEQYFDLAPLLLALDKSLLNHSNADLEFIHSSAKVLTEKDLSIIRDDWEIIRKKVAEDKAHELSEGDTNYLKACRKGSGGEDEYLRKQTGTTIRAKSRAFSFKQSFLTAIAQDHKKNFASIGAGGPISIEEATEMKFKPFIGLTESEISKKIGYLTLSKSRKWLYSNRILSSSGKKVEELAKAGITLKTVSLSKDGKNREDMSFPAFKSEEVQSQDWEDSDFSYQIETKFLFVVFQEDDLGVDRLKKVMYWTMPYEDRVEARRVWENARHRMKTNPNDLPRKTESSVAHVRPHAKNAKDFDSGFKGQQIVKKCFWLNAAYIANIVN